VGDQVVGLIHGRAYKGVGSAAEYAVVDEKLCWGLPKGMELKEAVTFGTAFITAALVSSRLLYNGGTDVQSLYVDHGISQSTIQMNGEQWVSRLSGQN
jgi:NADPH:quinone reductase-like Zn-dependent oxidoreductase